MQTARDQRGSKPIEQNQWDGEWDGDNRETETEECIYYLETGRQQGTDLEKLYQHVIARLRSLM